MVAQPLDPATAFINCLLILLSAEAYYRCLLYLLCVLSFLMNDNDD